MDEFLTYFRAAQEQPGAVAPWSRWWAEHRNRAEDLLEPADFELLRTGRLEGARMILRRSGLAWPSAVRVTPLWGAPSLSGEKLAAFEQERGIRLPPDYREFLLAYNGGYVRPCCFRCPGERQIAAFSSVGGTMIPDLDRLPDLPGEYLPIAAVNAAGSLCGSGDVLLLGAGAVWFWPGLHRVAGTFDELMGSLDYPEQAKPWMERIERGDVAGFRQWVEASGDIGKRDPASGVTPLEYCALERDFNLPLGEFWVGEEGKRRRGARVEIAKLLLERGAEPGHAFPFAVLARNFEIAALVPLDRTGTGDLREAWERLREGPGAKPQLLEKVSAELEQRKRKPREVAAATVAVPAGPEALAWLRESQNESALASNRFGDTAAAIRFVEELYAAGAARVIIPEESIQDEGDQLLYADALVVVLPPERSQREALFRMCDQESDADLPAAEDRDTIYLCWD
jgi:hypothetical protein